MDRVQVFDFIKKTIIQISDDHLLTDEITPHSTWFDMSLDSMQTMGFAGLVERKLGVEISEDSFAENTTIDDLATHIFHAMLLEKGPRHE